MNNYLVMRKPQFSSNGIIVKRRKKNKRLSETGFNQKPRSHKLQKGDLVYIYETKYGISFKKILNSLESFDQNSLSMNQLTSIIIKSIEIKNPKIRYNPTKDPIQKLWPYIPKKIMDSFF